MIEFIAKLILSIASCLGTIFTLLAFFGETDTYNEFLYKIGYPNGFSREVVALCLFILFVLILLWRFWNYIKVSKTNSATSEEIHFFYHYLRDESYKLKIINDKDTDLFPYNDHEHYYTYVKNVCYTLCEKIYMFLESKCKKEFSVCIKMLDVKTSYYGETGDIKLFTLCRAGKNHDMRTMNSKNKKSVTVKDNTDFDTILSKNEYNNSIFACSNLLMLWIIGKIFNTREYRNTTVDFWKYYLSTIVVPIRISKELLPETHQPNVVEGYQTVAFLCIDYRWPISKALKTELTGYIKSFGDTFYFLFYEIIVGDRKTSKKQDSIKGKRVNL